MKKITSKYFLLSLIVLSLAPLTEGKAAKGKINCKVNGEWRALETDACGTDAVKYRESRDQICKQRFPEFVLGKYNSEPQCY